MHTPPWAEGLHWPNRFAGLGPAYYTPLAPQGLPEPRLVAASSDCAALMGWPMPDASWLPMLAGQALWPGMQSLASVYSGHQFGVWAGQLGDGRAHWLGEVNTPNGGLEVQLKGSGLTPYSRMGDGRAVLRSSIREFLASEAMHHLGLPTTRALAVVASPLPVRRERMESAAIVTRVAPSFLRFGHFEHFAFTAGPDGRQDLAALLDFAIAHFDADCAGAPHPAAAWLERVVVRTARVVAGWQAVGFCHGVLNTDNCSILGLTIDYGPFAFVEAFDPAFCPNHSDQQGRYALHMQPAIMGWNLQRLASALGVLQPDDEAYIAALVAAVQSYRAAFEAAYEAQQLAKLGAPVQWQSEPWGGRTPQLGTMGRSIAQAGLALAMDGLTLMRETKADYTLACRSWADVASGNDAPWLELIASANHTAQAIAWAERLRAWVQQAGWAGSEAAARIRSVSPRIVLRTHLAQAAIEAAEAGDDAPTHNLLSALTQPFSDSSELSAYASAPPPWAQCAHLSCSS